MATEPTLGARIQETVFDWVAAGDVLGWGNPRVQEMRAAFVTLAARADAAERLAKASDTLDSDDWSEVDADGVPMVVDEHEAALAAWRAIEAAAPS